MKRSSSQIASTSNLYSLRRGNEVVSLSIQKYRDCYTKEWPCLITSCVNENHVFCKFFIAEELTSNV